MIPRRAKVATPAELRTDDPAIAEAAQLIVEGWPVALPTETVYGLAADATSAEAAARVFDAKDRPRFDPLIVHIPSEEWLGRVATVPTDRLEIVQGLTATFWPGPLTILLPRSELIPDLVTSGSPLVAVRLPAHACFRAVSQAANRPLAAPSANRFGRVSPTDAAAVVEELGDRIRLILDCGATSHGIESTIVEPLPGGVGLAIRRPGPITAEQLCAIAPVLEFAPSQGLGAQIPGGMESHYAPATPLRLFTMAAEFPKPASDQRIGAILWDTPPEGFSPAKLDRWSASCDLVEAASRLFRILRDFDASGLDEIWAQAVPQTGVGVAINDRLRRAAAKRPGGPDQVTG